MGSSMKCFQRCFVENQIWSYGSTKSYCQGQSGQIGKTKQNLDKRELKELQSGMDWEKSNI